MPEIIPAQSQRTCLHRAFHFYQAAMNRKNNEQQYSKSLIKFEIKKWTLLLY